jgi:hypothetical protein
MHVSLRVHQSILIGRGIEITVTEMRAGRVRLEVRAPGRSIRRAQRTPGYEEADPMDEIVDISDCLAGLFDKPGPEPDPHDRPRQLFHRTETVFDIETAPRSGGEIGPLIEDMLKTKAFDPSSVKLGRTTDPIEIAGKIAEARQAHEEKRDEERRKLFDEAALYPLTGKILAIGYLRPNEAPEVIGHHKTEEEILRDFWAYYLYCRQRQLKLIGFNIFHFDLPFIVKRSWHLDVPYPRAVLRDYRYWCRSFVDLMQVWGCGVWGERISLKRLAMAWGLTPKNGSGADFARKWETNRAEAVAYLNNDLQMTMDVAVKMREIETTITNGLADRR